MIATALGWSGFLVEDGGVRVAFDPHWSMWRPAGLLPPWDLHPLHALVSSHGHDDHYEDVPHLMALHPHAVLAGAPELVADAERRLGRPGRCVAAPTHGWGTAGPLSVRRIPGRHVGGGPVEQAHKFLRYLGRRPFWALDMLMHHVLDPSLGGVHSMFVRFPTGATVLHAAETVHRDADLDLLLQGVGAERIDLLLLGIEPGEEDAALAAAARLGPRQTVAFTPHRATRAWFGLDERRFGVDPQRAIASGAAWLEQGGRWASPA